jgi:glycosyltransferase involved in cell wall biosynthesis
MILGSLPIWIGRALSLLGLQGGAWTALRMSRLISLRIRSIHEFLNEVDCIIVLCTWVKNVLAINGIPQEKMLLVRHGSYIENIQENPGEVPVTVVSKGSPLRFIFLGRIDPTKGIDTLIRALRRKPHLPIELHIYGIIQSDTNKDYAQKIKKLIAGDQRVKVNTPVAHDKVIGLLKNFDALVVPSRWMETGPLVVLEAFEAGVPVIGSNLGGIAELIEQGINGILLPYNSVGAWSEMLDDVCDDRQILSRLKSGVKTKRRMRDVAREMVLIYEQIINRHKIGEKV